MSGNADLFEQTINLERNSLTMREEEQIRLRRRNAELEDLVRALQAQLQERDDALPKVAPFPLNGKPCQPKTPSDLQLALHLSQARYAAIVEDQADVVCRFLPNGTLVDMNEACCRYFGRSRSSLLGDNFFNLVAQTDCQSQRSVVVTGEAIDGYEQCQMMDGQTRWHRWTSRAIRDLQGNVVEFQAIGRDLTDLKLTACREGCSPLVQLTRPESATASSYPQGGAQLQAEVMRRKWAQESFRASEERYRSIVAAMHEGVMVLNADGTIQTCNASAERILQRSSSELYQRNVLDIDWQAVHEDLSPFASESFPGMITARTGVACSEVVMGLCKSGQVTWISVNSQPLFRPSDRVSYAVVVSFSDITLRKWVEAERAQLLTREQAARAEAELAREQISQILQSITDGFVALDRDSRFTYINPEAARTLGKSAGDLIGEVIWKEFPTFGETSFGRLYRRALSEGVPLELTDYYAPCAQWYSVRAYPSKGGVSLYFRNMTDSVQTIHERDQAQEALREAMQRLTFHVDNSPLAVVEWDRSLKVTRWSREAETLFGWEIEEVLGRQFGSWSFVVPEDMETVDQTIAALLNGEATRNVSYHRNFTQTGAIVHCEWYNSVLFDESGELISILSLVQNITQRTQAEEELRESEERFRQLAENIQQIFWMYAVEDQKLIYISPACEQVLGYGSKGCYHKSPDFWLSRVHLADLHSVLKTSRKVLRGKPAEVMYRFTRADGAERWLLARAFPVRDQQGKVYRIAGIAEDITDRKQQEQRLRLLESVIVNANDAIVITEAEPVELPGPKIIYVNQAFTRMMGYAPDQVVGKTPRILQGANTDWGILQQIRTALKKWEPSLVELVNYHKDGSEVWVELSMFPVTDQIGQYTYWVGLQRDVTQRKKTEEALQRQNLRSQLFADVTLKIRQSLHLEEILQTTVTEVRNLLQADRVLINRLSPDGTGTVTHEAVSPGWHSLIGGTYKTELLLPGHPQTDYRSVVQAVEDIEQEASPTSDFLRSVKVRARLVVPIVQQDSIWGLLVAHQGSPRQWSSFEIELLQQLSNQVEIALTQSQLLQALRESEERFRTMANSAPVLLWMIDFTGEFVFCNESLLEFMGHTRHPEDGSFFDAVHPIDRPYCEATYQEASKHRTSFEIEYRLRRADGDYRWVIDRGVPRFMPDGSFGGHIGSCIDITDRKQAEVEICKALETERELSELKSRFVSTASHEFRTPLSTILSSADLLEFYAGDWTPDKQIEHIQRIQNAALNMNNLLSDILVIERAEAKKLNFEPAPIDLLAFCQRLLDEMQLNDQQDHKLILEVQSSGKLDAIKLDAIPAHMDEKLLRQIFSNLLSNAIKYSPSGSSIVCRLTCESNQAIFEVQDQGIGISVEDQARLFEPFHRGMNVGTISGNGLGLAIVKQSIEVHRGQISVSSQEGVGTTIRVSLPLHSVAEREGTGPVA
ncbi:PAS domain S-box protein [Phormidesmis sp. 146-33]